MHQFSVVIKAYDYIEKMHSIMSISLHEYDVMKQFLSHNGNKENKHNTYAAAGRSRHKSHGVIQY